MSTVFAKIQMRRGTAAEWAASNPVLAQGEMAFETDTGITKIGDGGTAYASLPAYATYDQMLEAQQALEEAAVDVAAVEASKVAAAASATTATTKAGEASASAAAALASEQTADVKAQEAEQARVDAIAYAGVAETKAAEIVASAEAAAADAAAADADRIAAEAARAGAEAAQGIAEGAAAAALASEDAALASAEQATGAAAQSLAIYGSVDAQNTAIATAQAQASLAAGYAASAASVAQQDLSAVIAQALHRSPNAITSMFIYDTSKDSDGGAWTEKCQHTSWWNEAINGKWLGQQASELQARNQGAVVSATELVTNGGFDTDTVWGKGGGWSISGGVAVAANANNLTMGSILVVGKTYRATITISSYVSGVLKVGNVTGSNYVTVGRSVGIYQVYFTATDTALAIRGGGDFNGSIDNVSIREVTAVTTQTGDYFQLSTDGKFYRLNAGSGVTEVFRGNKRDFPRLAGIVMEGATSVDCNNIAIYDLTEPGRPMWMAFRADATNKFPVCSGGYALRAISMLNGELLIGGDLELFRATFPSDRAVVYSSLATWRAVFNGGIGSRMTALGYTADNNIPALPNRMVNAIAMTVLPDAPVDPVTGLRVPTIAVATASGVSVIKHNGVVVNSASTLAFEGGVTISPSLLIAQFGGSQVYTAPNPGSLGSSFALSERTSPPDIVKGSNRGIVPSGNSLFARRFNALALSSLWKANQSSPSRGLSATITPTHNTGWMTGDIRRAYLSDVGAGSLTGPELIVNGTFASDLSGWTIGGNASSVTVVGGAARHDVSVAAADMRQTLSLVAGRTYVLEYAKTVVSGGETIGTQVFIGTVAGGSTVLFDSHGGSANRRVTFVATANTLYLTMRVGGGSPVAGAVVDFDNVSLREVVADRSYRGAVASINGTLTRAELASGTSLVAYSGWSAANYLRESYSADLDFGTGEWTASAWVNVPTSLQVPSFPAISGDLATNGGFSADTSWANRSATGVSIAGGVLNLNSVDGSYVYVSQNMGLVAGKNYAATITVTRSASGYFKFSGGSGTYGQLPVGFVGTATIYFTAISPSVFLERGAGVTDIDVDSIIVREVGPAILADRAAAAGARLRLGIDAAGRFVAEAFDGTTTRTVTTSAAYNTATWLKARVNYTTDGTLAILVNGREVAATRGAPLLTLNNASAVLTIGNSFALDAPFPGSIALLKLGATVPTPEQAVFMYEQEKQLFRAGALSVLPDSGALVDMAYDDATDRWVAVSAANESYWTGLVRNSVQAVPAGSFTKVAAGSGVELAARSTTDPGVDVTIPAYGLREELVRRAEAAARLSKELAVYDFAGGFTANTTNGSAAITSVAGLTYPGSLIGARVSGSGIPANTRIVGVSGTTIYLSATATATATGVSVSFLDFNLPVGLEAKAVLVGGALKQEGSTKDFTRLFDGFLETIRFGTAPGATAWVQIQATKGTVQ